MKTILVISSIIIKIEIRVIIIQYNTECADHYTLPRQRARARDLPTRPPIGEQVTGAT